MNHSYALPGDGGMYAVPEDGDEDGQLGYRTIEDAIASRLGETGSLVRSRGYGADSSSTSEEEDEDGAAAFDYEKATDDQLADLVREAASSSARTLVQQLLRSGGDSQLILRKASLRVTSGPSSSRDLLSASQSAADGVVDWHGRLQRCLRADPAERAPLLFELTRDFNETARTYGKIIIMERHLPAHRKSLQPRALGGGSERRGVVFVEANFLVNKMAGVVAGGMKFVVANIVFKFAHDVMLPNGEYLYGGNDADDEAAHKAAGHERKGVDCILRAAVDGVSVPLMTLVDFRGFRLSAQSLAPLAPNSLVYGSADGGRTVACHALHMKRVEQLGRALKLADHPVRDAGGAVHVLCLPVDVEVHCSAQDASKLVVLDTARLMPPMYPQPGRRRDIYSRLFRSEFVARYRIPLSSDALSGFGVLDQERHNADVREATRVLLEETIPAAASVLTSQDTRHVTRTLQEQGVNARFLGRVRAFVVDQGVRQALLIEMMARTAVKLLRAQWRAGDVGGVSQQVALRLAVAMLNRLRLDADGSWLLEAMEAKYGPEGVHGEILVPSECLQRFCELGGIHLSPGSQDGTGALSVLDVEIYPRVKEIGISSLAEADQLVREAKKKRNDTTSLDLLCRAIRILERELVSDPNSVPLHCRLARALLVRLSMLCGSDGTPCLDSSTRDAFSSAIAACGAALDGIPEAANDGRYYRAVWYRYQMIVACARLQVGEAARCWVRAVELTRNLSVKEDWVLTYDSDVAKGKVGNLQGQLEGIDWKTIVASITHPSDYKYFGELILPLLRRGALGESLSTLRARDALTPKLVWLAIEYAPTDPATVAVLETLRSERVDVAALTHRALDFETLALLKPALACAPPLGLMLRRALCTASELRSFLEACPKLEMLGLRGCEHVSISGLGDIMSKSIGGLRSLELSECGSLVGTQLWDVLPATLEELDVHGCPRLEFGMKYPKALRNLDARKCGKACMTRESAAALPRELSRLLITRMTREAGAVLPEGLKELWVSEGELYGGEVPQLAKLESVSLGSKVNEDGLLVLCQSSRSIARLSLAGCRISDSDKISKALSLLPQLTWLDISRCGQLHNEGVVGGLLSSGARLQTLKSGGAWMVTSAQISRVLDPLKLRKLHFFGPRAELVSVAGRAPLVSLKVHHSSELTADHWNVLCGAAPTLRRLSLRAMPVLTDEQASAMLGGATKLERLSLRGCTLLSGSCLAALSGVTLRSLRLEACCDKSEYLLGLLERSKSLVRLRLESSGSECSALWPALARNCKKFRRLHVMCPSLQDLNDSEGWVSRIASLRRVAFPHTRVLGLSVLPFLQQPQLSFLHWVSSYAIIEESIMTSIAGLPSLTTVLGRWQKWTLVQLKRLCTPSRLFMTLEFTLESDADIAVAIAHLSQVPSLCFVSCDQVPKEQLSPRFGPSPLKWQDTSLSLEPSTFGDLLDSTSFSWPPLEMRTQWAVMGWCADSCSFSLAFALMQKGFRVIALEFPSSYNAVESATMDVARAHPLLRDAITFVTVEMTNAAAIREAVARITPHVDLLFSFAPYVRLPGLPVPACFPFMRNIASLSENVVELGLQSVHLPQATIVRALHPLLMLAPSPRVFCYFSTLGSLEEVSTPGLVGIRVGHVATAMLVRSLAFDLSHGVVVGAHVGLWVPGLRVSDGLASSVAPEEAAARFIQLLDLVKPQHSGNTSSEMFL